jgi:hypothetical protein
MSKYEECPICLENKALETPMCRHKLCSSCIGYLCSPDCPFEKKCPICRQNYSLTEILTYGKLNPKNMQQFIELHLGKFKFEQSQVDAIDDFFSGKIDYAQMRRFAG